MWNKESENLKSENYRIGDLVWKFRSCINFLKVLLVFWLFIAEFEISRKENLEIFENYTIEKPRDPKCENLISSKFEAVKIIKNSARV